nr:hypothetical protein [Tanacetum cinerariifolium]
MTARVEAELTGLPAFHRAALDFLQLAVARVDAEHQQFVDLAPIGNVEELAIRRGVQATGGAVLLTVFVGQVHQRRSLERAIVVIEHCDLRAHFHGQPGVFAVLAEQQVTWATARRQVNRRRFG